MKKPKKKIWSELKDEKCPKCKCPLTKGMFGDLVGCECGFIIETKTKDLLVKRDHNE